MKMKLNLDHKKLFILASSKRDCYVGGEDNYKIEIITKILGSCIKNRLEMICMKRIFRIILATVFISMLSFIASCSNDNITIGFDNNSGARYIWHNDVKLGLKTTKTGNETKEIDLYYGFSNIIINGINWDSWENSDFEQKIKFSLFRYDIKYGDFNNKIINEVYSFQNTLGYFLSEEFLFEKSHYIDTITKDDLIEDNNERMIIYIYKLTPVEDVYIQLACTAKNDYTYKNEEIKTGDIVGPDSSHNLFTEFSSMECQLFYKLNNNKVSFYTYSDRK